MITTARKVWEARRREQAGQSRIRILAGLAGLHVKEAARRAGPDRVFAVLLAGWFAAALATIGLLAAH